ncbi:hypothetical protein [Streptomyces sp. NPDC048496]|uniref:hypothetical protein n=1 Tax=Streptomyces sp. NPDC048496 TaxID=3365558 RepID=UPI0037186B17
MNRSRSGAEETDVSITPPKTWAVGAPAVANALRYSLEQTTVRRTALTLLNLDRTRDFDCPGGAWPEPDPAHPETNVLVPLDSTAEISNTPTWKGIVVRLERTTTGAAGATDTAPRSDGP